MSTGHRLLDAVLEAEVEADALLEKQVGRLDVTKGKLKKLARRIHDLRVAGKLGKAEAKQMFRTGFVALMLEEYVFDLPSLVAMTDRHLKSQVEALRETGSKGLRPIRKEEVKQRASEKAKEGK